MTKLCSDEINENRWRTGEFDNGDDGDNDDDTATCTPSIVTAKVSNQKRRTMALPKEEPYEDHMQATIRGIAQAIANLNATNSEDAKAILDLLRSNLLEFSCLLKHVQPKHFRDEISLLLDLREEGLTDQQVRSITGHFLTQFDHTGSFLPDVLPGSFISVKEPKAWKFWRGNPTDIKIRKKMVKVFRKRMAEALIAAPQYADVLVTKLLTHTLGAVPRGLPMVGVSDRSADSETVAYYKGKLKDKGIDPKSDVGKNVMTFLTSLPPPYGNAGAHSTDMSAPSTVTRRPESRN